MNKSPKYTASDRRDSLESIIGHPNVLHRRWQKKSQNKSYTEGCLCVCMKALGDPTWINALDHRASDKRPSLHVTVKSPGLGPLERGKGGKTGET